jgi:chemotaxis protein MotB
MPENSNSDAKKGKERPIIIKKISGGGHGGHHGGAWKVAYADFVTAMMAFFLLMWLLNAVPSDKLRGVAQYFEPTVGMRGHKGIGVEGGQAYDSEEGIHAADKARGVTYGVLRKGEIFAMPEKGTDATIEEMENEHFALVEGELEKVIATDPEITTFKDSISLVQTPEGLVIQLMDQDEYPMFKAGSAELQNYTKGILLKIIRLIQYSPNLIAIDGYTDKFYDIEDVNYTNWELSADRANATRRFLVSNGIVLERIARVSGHADNDPIVANPQAPQNRRVAITLLRTSIAPPHKLSKPTAAPIE